MLNAKTTKKPQKKAIQKKAYLTTPPTATSLKEIELSKELIQAQNASARQRQQEYIKKQIKPLIKDLALSSQTQDRSSNKNNEPPSNQGNILPGAYDPLKNSGAYQQNTQAPGAINPATKTDPYKGGGPIKTPETDRAKNLVKLQEQKKAKSMFTGETESKTTQPPTQKPSTTSKNNPQSKNQMLDRALQLKMVQQSKIYEKFKKAQKIKEEIKKAKEMVKKAKKLAKLFDDLIKASEIVGSETIVPLITLVLQEYLEVINKYTFKSELLPETFFLEDIIIVWVTFIIMIDILMPIFIIVIFLTITYIIVNQITSVL